MVLFVFSPFPGFLGSLLVLVFRHPGPWITNPNDCFSVMTPLCVFSPWIQAVLESYTTEFTVAEQAVFSVCRTVVEHFGRDRPHEQTP
jgi:hypothetical protein